jgi:hypothetical protein
MGFYISKILVVFMHFSRPKGRGKREKGEEGKREGSQWIEDSVCGLDSP